MSFKIRRVYIKCTNDNMPSVWEQQHRFQEENAGDGPFSKHATIIASKRPYKGDGYTTLDDADQTQPVLVAFDLKEKAFEVDDRYIVANHFVLEMVIRLESTV